MTRPLRLPLAACAENRDYPVRFMKNRPCFSTLNVPYAHVVADPRAEAARINDFLGGRLDVEKVAAVADRALYRNRGEQAAT